jgi:hypothetical protein
MEVVFWLNFQPAALARSSPLLADLNPLWGASVGRRLSARLAGTSDRNAFSADSRLGLELEATEEQ